MAKDILKFHAVIWPALLMAAGLELPQRMAIHGFLLMGEKKMSKCLGNVLDPFEVIERFGADALRFYSSARSASARTARSRPPASSPATRPSSPTTSATSPAGCWRWSTATAPATVPEAPGRRRPRRGLRGRRLPRFRELLDRAELTQALEVVWALVRRLNRYVEETKPWELAKDEADPERLDEVLYNLVEGLRVTTLLLHPLPARTADRCSRRSPRSRAARLAELGSRAGGQSVERVPPLFPKIED